MPKQPNKTLIGLFIAAGIAIIVITAGIYIKTRLSGNKQNTVVMYFEESIKGLNVGSAVIFKGVEIGNVTKIGIFANPDSMDFSIAVYAELNNQNIRAIAEYRDKKKLLEKMIEKGLRARLTTKSYVTGQLMIEFTILPNASAFAQTNRQGYLVVPTTLSSLAELSRDLQSLPVKQSIDNFNKFFTNLNNQMPQVESIIDKIDSLMGNNPRAVTGTLYNLNQTMTSIREASDSFRNLTDYLERHPEALLKGKEK